MLMFQAQSHYSLFGDDFLHLDFEHCMIYYNTLGNRDICLKESDRSFSVFRTTLQIKKQFFFIIMIAFNEF